MYVYIKYILEFDLGYVMFLGNWIFCDIFIFDGFVELLEFLYIYDFVLVFIKCVEYICCFGIV